MPITITTLNNSQAVAKTFTEVSKDRNTAEWINSTDTAGDQDSRLIIKQQIIGKTKNGVPLRRSLVQTKITRNKTDLGEPLGFVEEITVNLTITSPTSFSAFSAQHREDMVAFIKNLMTNANVDALAQGQV